MARAEPLLVLARLVVDFAMKGPASLGSLDTLESGLQTAYDLTFPVLAPVMKVQLQVAAPAHLCIHHLLT